MRTIGILLIGVIIAGIVSCSMQGKSHSNDGPFPATYENDLFSINFPEGWICDSSEWGGLDAPVNSVDIFDPDGNVVWFHIVKTFMPIKWKNVDEAKEGAKTARLLLSGYDNVELIYELDSVEVGGYPTRVLYFANFVDNDTIIQKQFVTYLQDSHIVVYFNENFYYRDLVKAQDMGDSIIGTIKLKKVINPLENDSIYNKAWEELDRKSPIDEYGKPAGQLYI